ncbi:UNVERIFIED_CONTAM: hypothetical protein K2H54_009724 [Gekko kuhli]
MMSGEDGEVPTTVVEGTVSEQGTTAALVANAGSKGLESGVWTQDSWAEIPTWAEPNWVVTLDPRLEKLAYDGTQRHYRRSFQDDPECILAMENIEVECLHREFRAGEPLLGPTFFS